MGKGSGKRRGALRSLFVLAAGALALASVAWACVSHEAPDAKPDLKVVRADGNQSEFVMFNRKAAPAAGPNDYQMTKTFLRRGQDYLWSAGNLQTYTAYSIRLSKRYQGNDPPLDSGVWQSNPFDRDVVDTGTNICGNVINWNPAGGLYEYSVTDNLIGRRETNGTPSTFDDHWALTPTSFTFPATNNAPPGTWDICVTPTTRSVTAPVPVGVNGTSVEVTVL